MTNRSYSYSQIQAALKCNRYYKLLYVDQLKSPLPHSADMSFGTALHLGVETFLRGGDGLEMFHLYWDTEREKERRYGRNDWEKLKAQGDNLLVKFKKYHSTRFVPFKLEERLHSTLEEIRLEGTPDFVGVFDGVPSIVDFKTTSSPYKIEKLITNEQLPLYAYMVEKEWSYKAEQIVYFPFVKGASPSIQTPLVVKLADLDMKGTLDNLLSVCREIDARTHFPQNRASCTSYGTCDMYSICFPKKLS